MRLIGLYRLDSVEIKSVRFVRWFGVKDRKKLVYVSMKSS